MTDPVTDYAAKVLEGDIPAGPYVVWACERHFRDLERDDIYLDLAEVQRRIAFFPLLKHWKGEFAGKEFHLSAWQQFRIGSFFGWMRHSTRRRRFVEAYTEIPRKNGKTTEAAGIGLSGMLLDGEMGSEVYAVATKRDQAKIVWEDAKMMVKSTPALSKRIRAYVSNLNCLQMASKFEALGRDSKTLDGLNPYYVLYDEFHAYRDPYLRTVMQNGMGSRKDPVEWIITTAGNETETMCYELREHALNVLDPEQPDFDDDTLFAYVACPYADDDPGSPATWATANPNLGISKSVDFLQRRWDRACQVQSEMNEFLSKQLNIWTSSVESWLRMAAWEACDIGSVDLDAVAGRKCYAGLDLAAVNDLSALAMIYPDTDAGHWDVRMRFWCPQENIRDRARFDKVPYDLWAKQGHITPTPGKTTDYAFIEHAILEAHAETPIEALLYDRWNANQLIRNLEAAGINCVACGQGYQTQSPALREIERRVTGQSINHGGHPILRWNANNAQVIRDPADNIKLNKKDPRKRIDGIAALANAAFGIISDEGDDGPSVYEDRGIIEL